MGRLWRVQSIVHPLRHTSADYSSQPYADHFGNFLRRLAFALASTFLYCIWYVNDQTMN
jgi:hypothetical protein